MVITLEKADSDILQPPKEIASRRQNMRLLVCGDRNWVDYKAIYQEIKMLRPEIVMEGEARGADSLARIAAQELGIEVIKFPADWNNFGKAAGPIRNAQMLKEGKPDLVLAFHDDLEHSKGTKHMVEIAKKTEIPVKVWTHNKVKIREIE